MALNDDSWNGPPATTRPVEDLDPPPSPQAHPLRATTIALGVACALAAPVLLQTDEFLALVLAGAFLGGGHSALLWTATQADHRLTARVLTRIAGSAGVGSVVAVAGGCLYPSIGVPAAGLVLAALLSLPYLVRRVASRSDRPRPSRPRADSAGGGPTRSRLPKPPLVRRSTPEIAAAWTASRELLRRTTSPQERAVVAELRQAYLDELERRDPECVRRWLESGQAFDSDVAGYLSARDTDRPGDDAG